MAIVLDGNNLTTTGMINSLTAVNSTSGTSIDFTGIPTGVKRVTVMFNGVSTSGTAYVQIQLGTSGGFTTSGYLGASQQGGSPVAYTTGFLVSTAAAAASVRYGIAIIANVSSNIWAYGANISDTNNNWATANSGVISLSGALTSVRITTSNGTDTFDAGSINIFYE